MYIPDTPHNYPTSMDNIGRIYHTPKGNYYSVTTMLSATKPPSDSLSEWKKKVGEKEAERICNVAKIFGTKLHETCEDYLLKQPNRHKKDFMVNKICNKILPFIDQHCSNVIASEINLYSDEMKLAGTADGIVVWDNKLSILDFKTCKYVPHPDWITDYWIQLAIYARMYNQLYNTNINQLVLLFAPKQSNNGAIKIDLANNWNKQVVDRILQFRGILHNEKIN